MSSSSKGAGMSQADVLNLSVATGPDIVASYLEEPLLLFGSGGVHLDPRAGIAGFGPYSLGLSTHPATVRVGLVGAAEHIETARLWLERAAEGITGDKTNPSFPGFAEDRGFFSTLKFDDLWDAQISQTEMATVLGVRGQRDRFEAAVELYTEKIRLVAERDQPPDYLILTESDEFVQRCGVADFFDKDVGAVHRDFRRAMKAAAMKFRVPTQLLRQRTMEGRDPTAPAKIAWNYCTGLYYKAGGFPWVPRGLEPGTCFIGVSFYRPLGSRSTLQTSLVQAFNEYGDSLILRGHEFDWDPDREGSRSPHLNEEPAARLVDLALDRYELENGTPARRVVVQKSSQYWPQEREGFVGRLSERVQRFDLLSLDTRQSNVRLITTTKYPPLRGTRFKIGDLDYLYTTGFIPALREFHGVHVPSPIQISDHVGQDTSRTDLLREILLLTKLNWNSAMFCGKLPVTLKFAGLVGEIMKEVSPEDAPLPQFKFYI
jgi:hypothetical protein